MLQFEDDDQRHLIEAIRDAFKERPIRVTISCAALTTATNRRSMLRQAIVRYLEYRAAHTWDFAAEKINAALDSYWRSSLN